MTKVGFNLLAWSAKVSEDMYPITERLKKIGYDGVEIFIGVSDKKAYKKFGDFTKSLDLEITGVSGFGPDDNPISPDAAVREKAVERLKWLIDCANEMDCKLIGGPLHSAFATFANKAPDEDEYKRSAEVLSKSAEYAAKADVVLAIEAINRFECYLCNTVAQMADIVKRVSHPNVTAHYDTHHANIEEKGIIQSIHNVAPVLGHVHISESDRGTPGDGNVPWNDVFAAFSAIGYDKWFTIEAFSRNDIDFANSINVWREFSKPWDVAEKGFDLIQKMKKKHKL